MKSILVAVFLFILTGCHIHLFVPDDKYVRSEYGYLLFRKDLERNDPYSEISSESEQCVNGSDLKTATLFLKGNIKRSIVRADIIKVLEKGGEIWEIGNYCGRESDIQLADTLFSDEKNIYFVLPANISFTTRGESKYQSEITLSFDKTKFKLNVWNRSISLTAVDALNSKLF